MPHLDLNQALINQFQPQTQTPTLEELLALLQGGNGGTSIVPRSISSTGFMDAPTAGEQPSMDLADRLTQSFSGGLGLDAVTLDRLQRAGSVFGGLLGGPAGLVNLGLGQFARVAANQAFPTQEPIGFFEDILRPDFFAGTPLEILQERATGGTGVSRGAVSTIGGSRVSAGPVDRGGGRGGGFGRGRDPGGGTAGSPF